MKKQVAIILLSTVLAASPACASVPDHKVFSLYSEVFGAHDIDDAKADMVNNYSRFYQDGCTITFKEENGELVYALISGEGDSFLAYCYAILFQFDPDPEHSAHNGGNLLACYLMAHGTTEEQFGTTASGTGFILKKDKEGFAFSMKK